MAEKNWTPGPFTVEADDACVVRVPDGGRIAQMQFLKGRHGMQGRRDPDAVVATGRLFAAAPDMYAALEELVDWIDGMPVGDGHGMADEARAALAKARGEEAE